MMPNELRVPSIDRWADQTAKQDHGAIPALLHQLPTGRLGQMAAPRGVCVQQQRPLIDRGNTILRPDGFAPLY